MDLNQIVWKYRPLAKDQSSFVVHVSFRSWIVSPDAIVLHRRALCGPVTLVFDLLISKLIRELYTQHEKYFFLNLGFLEPFFFQLSVDTGRKDGVKCVTRRPRWRTAYIIILAYNYVLYFATRQHKWKFEKNKSKNKKIQHTSYMHIMTTSTTLNLALK